MTLVKVRKPNRTFPSIFDEFWKDWPQTENTSEWVPAANIKEEDSRYWVELSAPGFAKENINVSVEDDTLTITGDIKIEEEETKENYVKREFRKSNFKRSFNLNGMINIEKIDAKYADGILKIELPKIEEEVKQLKEIKVG